MALRKIYWAANYYAFASEKNWLVNEFEACTLEEQDINAEKLKGWGFDRFTGDLKKKV